jgi:hypothetical protein
MLSEGFLKARKRRWKRCTLWISILWRTESPPEDGEIEDRNEELWARTGMENPTKLRKIFFQGHMNPIPYWTIPFMAQAFKSNLTLQDVFICRTDRIELVDPMLPRCQFSHFSSCAEARGNSFRRKRPKSK